MGLKSLNIVTILFFIELRCEDEWEMCSNLFPNEANKCPKFFKCLARNLNIFQHFQKSVNHVFLNSFKAVVSVLRLDEFNLFSNFQPKPNIKQNGKKWFFFLILLYSAPLSLRSFSNSSSALAKSSSPGSAGSSIRVRVFRSTVRP